MTFVGHDDLRTQITAIVNRGGRVGGGPLGEFVLGKFLHVPLFALLLNFMLSQRDSCV